MQTTLLSLFQRKVNITLKPTERNILSCLKGRSRKNISRISHFDDFNIGSSTIQYAKFLLKFKISLKRYLQ